MFTVMHNNYDTNSTLTRRFLSAADAIAYAVTKGPNMAVHAPSGAIIWRSEYA